MTDTNEKTQCPECDGFGDLGAGGSCDACKGTGSVALVHCNACDQKHPAPKVFYCDECGRPDVCEEHSHYTRADHEADRGYSEGR